jgi:kinesin family protein 18/19
MDMLIRGNENRTQSPTEANATSSRSHAVLQINVAQKDRNAGHSEPTTFATLSIIDLAGSERASATKNRGERLLEGANINKSLLSLGSCINALCDPRKKNHVPYRNSKLTRLLKFSLGGNCRTVMIVCVSPSSVHFDETQNTLRYANRAKNIQTKAVRNVYNVDRHVKDYLKKIDEQMALIKDLQAQHKDFESIAFTKFKKLDDKRSALLKEALARIRAAYDHSGDDRKEHIGNMKRLRQIERRIALVSAWIGSFDQVCENRQDEEPPLSLTALRKTAQGIMVELEGSRQHYHKRLAKANWERSLDTALQNGIRQVQEVDSSPTMSSPAIASLKQEVEVLRSRAEREAQTAVLDQERAGDVGLVQVLLHAHFETVAILGQIMQMDEEEAVKAAKNVLAKLLNSCTEATSQVIRPDGGLAIIEAVPPTKSGTPKKKKAISLAGPSPIRAKIRSSLGAPQFKQSPNMGPSPASPRRRKLGAARKSVAFGGTPKKKSPNKTTKRGVRWRDDTEDGQLEEFQSTPPALESSLNEPSFTDMSQETASQTQAEESSENLDSSPLPPPPVPSSEIRSKNSRFQSGFLKKADGPPVMSALTSLATAASENLSPLREIEANSAPQPKGSPIPVSLQKAPEFTNDDSIHSNTSDNDDPTKVLQDSALQIQSAMRSRRISSGTIRYRRRSPAAQSSGSPNNSSSNENNTSLFTASHARRMVKSEKSEVANVLSPRSAPVVKNAPNASNLRSVSRDGSIIGGMRVAPIRTQSMAARNSNTNASTSAKNVWR